MTAPIRLSAKAKRTPESPISESMEQALSNPKLINLAAGMVDTCSLPVDEVAHAAAAASLPTRLLAVLPCNTARRKATLHCEKKSSTW